MCMITNSGNHMVNFKMFNYLKSIMETNLSNSDKGSIIFIIILAILLAYVAYYRIYDQLGLNSTITMFAVIVAMGTGLISQLHNRDSLKTAKESLETSKELNRKTLEQTEKNLRLQLIYNDRKKALLTLFYILRSKKNPIKEIKEYLNSSESFFLPKEIRAITTEFINNIDKMENEAPWMPSPDILEEIREQEEAEQRAIFESFSVNEEFEYIMDQEILNFKSTVSDHIRDSLEKNELQN